MAKMHTPAMERIQKKNAKRKKPVKSTPGYESWKRFKRNPTALIGLIVVCLLILIAILRLSGAGFYRNDAEAKP